MEPPPNTVWNQAIYPFYKARVTSYFQIRTLKLLKEELNFMPKIIWNNMI